MVSETGLPGQTRTASTAMTGGTRTGQVKRNRQNGTYSTEQTEQTRTGRTRKNRIGHFNRELLILAKDHVSDFSETQASQNITLFRETRESREDCNDIFAKTDPH
jgi:hypothetical protein